MQKNSQIFSFSQITTKVITQEMMGPAMKLMHPHTDNGMYEKAENCIF
jgi:hypothetical protein